MSLLQDLIPSYLELAPSTVPLQKLSTRNCDVIYQHILDHHVRVLGVSLRLAQEDGAVDAVAFATSTHVFLVIPGSDLDPLGAGGEELAKLLCSQFCTLVGFGMSRMALHLHREFGVRVQAVDLSTAFARSTREPANPADVTSKKIHPHINKERIHEAWYRNEVEELCLRAWLSSFLAERSMFAVERSLKVDTRYLTSTELQCLNELVMNVELLDAEKPNKMENEFDDVVMNDDGRIAIRNARFKTRIRRSKQTRVILETTGGERICGQAVRSKGKSTGIQVLSGQFREGITHIHVVGREESTASELARDEFILLLLQGAISSLARSPFIRMLWFPALEPVTKRSCGSAVAFNSSTPGSESFSSLNASQEGVVRAMLSEEEPIVIVHGPPGTGKTTTIAVAVKKWELEPERKPTWIVAQSNVGVQNIAEKFNDKKHRIDFRIIVSKEFYEEWHEHLYLDMENSVIRSDELGGEDADPKRMLGGTKIILCTISMLSNPVLDKCDMFHIVPVERLVVDEASQIDSFSFMHLLHKFKRLQKVCMFGDPQQLPPFGKETAPLMKTIFDFEQLKPSSYFLGTQYRMPVPLGDFISEEVYDSKLKSEHKITDNSCVRFVDVRKGCEESVGSSWRNVEEAHAITNIVKNYYRHHEFCIITPYDAQRAAITRCLKAEDLSSDCVFNVDSYQGHEAEYVIVSTVRTTSPGFLRSLNRMNVMLTRCKKGLVIVTQRRFLDNASRYTLLGKLARRWSAESWRDAWVSSLALSDRRASLPGAPGRAGAAQPLALGPPALARPQDSEVVETARDTRGHRGGWGFSSGSPDARRSVPVSPASPTSRSPLYRPPGLAAAAIADRADAAANGPRYGDGRLSSPSSPRPPATSGLAEGMALMSLRRREVERAESFSTLDGVRSVKPGSKGKWRSGSDAREL